VYCPGFSHLRSFSEKSRPLGNGWADLLRISISPSGYDSGGITVNMKHFGKIQDLDCRGW